MDINKLTNSSIIRRAAKGANADQRKYIGVSQWLAEGEKYGYQKFFLKKFAGEMISTVKRMKLSVYRNKNYENFTASEYNKALSDASQAMQEVLDKWEIKLDNK